MLARLSVGMCKKCGKVVADILYKPCSHTCACLKCASSNCTDTALPTASDLSEKGLATLTPGSLVCFECGKPVGFIARSPLVAQKCPSTIHLFPKEAAKVTPLRVKLSRGQMQLKNGR
mmetsp:Transcript_33326/g.85462  ORF Transcript_33326/g.85462 Transcript_33326/m.85462 type:complete len:118 (-) Transcript_33326:243-596(-)